MRKEIGKGDELTLYAEIPAVMKVGFIELLPDFQTFAWVGVAVELLGKGLRQRPHGDRLARNLAQMLTRELLLAVLWLPAILLLNKRIEQSSPS